MLEDQLAPPLAQESAEQVRARVSLRLHEILDARISLEQTARDAPAHSQEEAKVQTVTDALRDSAVFEDAQLFHLGEPFEESKQAAPTIASQPTLSRSSLRKPTPQRVGD